MLTPTTGGVKFFEHVQSSPASTWNVFHGFGSKPLIDVNVLDGGVVKKAFPLDILHIDENNVQILWSSPRAGTVSLASTIV